MNAEIENYKTKIEFLEKKVFGLEKLNKNLSASLQQQCQFSAKVANIIFDMDSLLTKKSDEIAHLKMQLLQSPADSNIEDFAIYLDKDSVESNYSPQPQITIDVGGAGTTSVDVNEYVIRHEFTKLDIERNTVGVFECPNEAGCYYKTSNFGDMERHFRTHSKEKPFECEICGKVFVTKAHCIAHIRSHDDSLKLRCSVCDKLFCGVGFLIKHTTKYHNGEGYIRKKRPRRSQQHANTIKKRRLAYELKIKTEIQ